MRLLPLLLIFCLLLSLVGFTKGPTSYCAIAPGGNDTSENYLMLKAHVRKSPTSINKDTKEENVWLDSALITIFYNQIPYSEIWTNKKGKCSFKLALNKNYLIEVSKDGFVSKSFEVNTKVPPNQSEVFSFDFDIDIFEKVKGLDVSVLEKPVAKVSYNMADERFAYDISFTNKINNELKKMYKNYYMLQKVAADTLEQKTSTNTGGTKKPTGSPKK